MNEAVVTMVMQSNQVTANLTCHNTVTYNLTIPVSNQFNHHDCHLSYPEAIGSSGCGKYYHYNGKLHLKLLLTD